MIKKFEEKLKERLKKHKGKLTRKASAKKKAAPLTPEQRTCKYKIKQILDDAYYIIFMTLVTVYALFFDDIRIIAFAKEADGVFYGITLACIVLYTAEVVASSWAVSGYMNSFFFWLDMVSTISMVPDCGWIWDEIVNPGSTDGGGAEDGQGGSDRSGSQTATDLAKTSRAGRITRVIRIIRLIRLIRIVKLYK